MAPDLVIYEGTAADVGWDDVALCYPARAGTGLGLHHLQPCPGPRRESSRNESPSYYKNGHFSQYIGISSPESTIRSPATARARGIPIFWVLILRSDGRMMRKLISAACCNTARTAGFSRVIDVTDAFDGLDPTGLAVESDDFHPNAILQRVAGWLGNLISP